MLHQSSTEIFGAESCWLFVLLGWAGLCCCCQQHSACKSTRNVPAEQRSNKMSARQRRGGPTPIVEYSMVALQAEDLLCSSNVYVTVPSGSIIKPDVSTDNVNWNSLASLSFLCHTRLSWCTTTVVAAPHTPDAAGAAPCKAFQESTRLTGCGHLSNCEEMRDKHTYCARVSFVLTLAQQNSSLTHTGRQKHALHPDGKCVCALAHRAQ
jgi:hypothetical protein